MAVDLGDLGSFDEPPEDGLDSPREGVFFSFLGEACVVFMAGWGGGTDVDFDSSRISFLLPRLLAGGGSMIIGAGVSLGLSRISTDLPGRSQL